MRILNLLGQIPVSIHIGTPCCMRVTQRSRLSDRIILRHLHSETDCTHLFACHLNIMLAGPVQTRVGETIEGARQRLTRMWRGGEEVGSDSGRTPTSSMRYVLKPSITAV